MTTHRTHPDPLDPAQDADRLGDAWDALVAGRRPPVSGADAELLAVVGQLTAEATHIRPTLTFRNSLRESLMHSGTMTMDGVTPTPTLRPLPSLGRPVGIASHAEPSAGAMPGRLRRVGAHWVAVAATAALLLSTAGGGYLATRGSGGGDSTRVAGFQFQAATPMPRVASPVADASIESCGGAAPYFPCTGPGPLVGIGFVVGSLYDAQVTAGVNAFEMQGWTIDPGQSVSLVATSSTPVRGIGVDIVTGGAYAATFSGPVTVSRTGPLNTSFEYPAPGTRVELSKGDGVSYALGTRTVISNPLESAPLLFKSLVFAPKLKGGAAATPAPESIEMAGGIATVVVDGQGTLPQALDEYDDGDMQIWLTYSQIHDPASFPPTIRSGAVVLGPVDAQDGPEGTEGYIVWAIQPQG